MLLQLSIKNFALIDKLDIEFDEKFNVLTGETGAGKSIIIDAVSLLLGARGNSEFIRVNKDKALIEGTFLIPEKHPLENLLEQKGYELDENKILILTREISLNGKNICRINNRIVTLSFFKEIGKQLINIYGQHDFQSLSQGENHIFLLDSLGKDNFQTLLKKVKISYENWKKYQEQINKLNQQLEAKNQRLDFLRFQIDEINNLNISEGEDERIIKELNFLNNWEKILSVATEGYEVLYGNNSAYDKISTIIDRLKDITNLDPVFSDICSNLENILYQVEDNARVLKDYLENISFDNDRKEYLIERKYAIDKLKRKYGNSIEEILNYKEKAEQELMELENSEIKYQELKNKAKEWENEYLKLAEELSDLRKKIACQLEDKITKQLKDLVMPHTKFKVKFSKIEPTRYGIDKIEFLISPNPGEPLKPLAKIASGGEMSRIMLAFKVILANNDNLTTLIFDEIDSGIGGHVVARVADKLHHVSNFYQVICVTHSPQIAALGHKHFKISKKIEKNTTISEVKALDEKDRIVELARMLGDDAEIAFEHAKELRNKALSEKN